MTKKKKAPLIVLSLIFLFNPNIQIVDLLPDFVAYFIIARLLLMPSVKAPYFEEARSSALKLGLVSVAKIPAFLLAIYIRSHNRLDNDIFPMLALIFAVVEIILLIGFINNLSSAFFHLGERGSAASLITSFPLSKNGTREMRPEDLRGFTIFFAVAKCLLYTVPELCLLTGESVGGLITTAPNSRFYPISLSVALVLGFIIGGVWLSRSKKFLRAVLSEGEFTASLNFLSRECADSKFEVKLKLRKIKVSLMLLFISAIFTFHLSLAETELVNVFPSFIFGAIFIFALSRLRTYADKSFLPCLISGAAFTVSSFLYYFFSSEFLKKYDYINLVSSNNLQNTPAHDAYTPVVIFSALELLALLVFFAFAFFYLYSFITKNTGLSPDSERYSKTEANYHKELKKRLCFFLGFGALTTLTKFIFTCLYISPKTTTSKNELIEYVITTPRLPWFGVVVTVSSIVFIGYALYYTRLLFDEVTLKYQEEK